MTQPTAPPLAPLAGLRVLDISAVLAGPNCARYLADFGADLLDLVVAHEHAALFGRALSSVGR